MPRIDLRDVLVVVPAFNEAASVAGVVRNIRLSGAPHILVVDDGSVDGTAPAAAAAGARVCRLPLNLGVGGAMRAGYRYAAQEGFGYVVQIDADGQHDPADMASLLEQLEQHDIVIGSRFLDGGSYSVKGPRRWAMRVLATVISHLGPGRLTDATSGYRAVNAKALELFVRHYPAEYLGDTVESLVIAARSGLTIGEVPVTMRYRETGTPSQSPLRASLYLGRAVIALALALVRRWPLPPPSEV